LPFSEPAEIASLLLNLESVYILAASSFAQS